MEKAQDDRTRKAVEGLVLFLADGWVAARLAMRQGSIAQVLRSPVAPTLIAELLWLLIRGRESLPGEWLRLSRTSEDPGIMYAGLLPMVACSVLACADESLIGHLVPFFGGSVMLNHSFFGWFGFPRQASVAAKEHAVFFITSLFTMAATTVLEQGFSFCSPVGFILLLLLAQQVLLRSWQLAFEKSFTPGEATVVINGLALICGDFMHYLLCSVIAGHDGQELFPPKRPVVIALQGGLIGVLLIPLAMFKFFQTHAVLENETVDVNPRVGPSPKTLERRRADSQSILLFDWTSLPLSSTALFYAAAGGFLVLVVSPLVTLLLGQNPILWVAEYTFSSTEHLLLLAFWGACLAAGLPLIHFIAASTAWPLIITRKLYHLMALFMFSPAMLYAPDFTSLSFGIACALLLLVEYIRICRVPPFGKWVHFYLRSYTDSRDEGTTILTHIYLLLGCAFPLWVFACALSGAEDESPPSKNVGRWYAAYGGLAILGAGDAAGAIIGSTLGRVRWPGGRKTLEGTLAAIGASLLTFYALSFFAPSSVLGEVGDWQTWAGIVWATLLTCLLEAFTKQIDNLTLPLIFASLLAVL